jgi:hypothetical protein
LGTHSELGGNVKDAFRTWWAHIKNFMVLKVLELLYFLARYYNCLLDRFQQYEVVAYKGEQD